MATVHSVVSKMIFESELLASHDQPSQSIVVHRGEPSRLQALALQVSEHALTKLGEEVD